MTKKPEASHELTDPFTCWTVELVAARLRWLMSLQHQARVRKTKGVPDLELARQTFDEIWQLLPGDDESRAVVSAVAKRQSYQKCANDLAKQQVRTFTGAALRKRWISNYGPLIAAEFNARRVPVRSEDISTARATPGYGRPKATKQI